MVIKSQNLKTPTDDNDSANKGFVNKSIADELSKLHITLPTDRENLLKYMLDADESSSEANIIVLDIVDIPDSISIHKYNKKGYSITIQKNLGSNNYNSKIGFNLYSLETGLHSVFGIYIS